MLVLNTCIKCWHYGASIDCWYRRGGSDLKCPKWGGTVGDIANDPVGVRGPAARVGVV